MTAWVLLRGLTRGRGHWGGFTALLQRRFPSMPVVSLDLPGNGALNRLRSPTRINAMRRWCQEELGRLGIEPPYALLAVSMGAMVALDWARADPGSIARCVVINTSLRPFDPWYRRLRPANYAALLRLALPGMSDLEREGAILCLTSHNDTAQLETLQAWVELRRLYPVSARNALRQVVAAARFTSARAAPGMPLLILASARDALVDVRCSRLLAQRWHAEIAVHEWAGHDLPLDDGPWVVEQMARWFGA